VGGSPHDVFLVAAPIARAGFLIVLLLREQPPRGREQAGTACDQARCFRIAGADRRVSTRANHKEDEKCQ
jgi:hypothetical protein